MASHMAIHEIDRPKLACGWPGCPVTLFRRSDLARHRRAHTERPFTCPSAACGKAFARRAHLDRHIKLCSAGGKKRRASWTGGRKAGSTFADCEAPATQNREGRASSPPSFAPSPSAWTDTSGELVVPASAPADVDAWALAAQQSTAAAAPNNCFLALTFPHGAEAPGNWPVQSHPRHHADIQVPLSVSMPQVPLSANLPRVPTSVGMPHPAQVSVTVGLSQYPQLASPVNARFVTIDQLTGRAVFGDQPGFSEHAGTVTSSSAPAAEQHASYPAWPTVPLPTFPLRPGPWGVSPWALEQQHPMATPPGWKPALQA